MKISIIGCGSFASALAAVLADNQHDCLLFTKNIETLYSINDLHINPDIFYSKKLNIKIKASNNIKEIIDYSDIIIIAVPTNAINEVLNKIHPLIGDNNNKIIINGAKGYDPETFLPLSKTYNKILKIDNIFSLNGPSFANEILSKNTTNINVVPLKKTAIKNLDKICEIFNNSYFKLVPNVNYEEIEFLSAVKNVYALLAGIFSEYEKKNNHRAIFFTHILQECDYMLKKLNLKQIALLSLGGFGDIYLTCSSVKSRNFTTGIEIAKLGITDVILNINKTGLTVEGIGMTHVLYEILKKQKINFTKIKLIDAIIQIIVFRKNPKMIINKI